MANVPNRQNQDSLIASTIPHFAHLLTERAHNKGFKPLEPRVLGNRVGYHAQDITNALKKALKVVPELGSFSRKQQDQIRQKLLQHFRNAAVEIKVPQIKLPQAKNHFLMVSTTSLISYSGYKDVLQSTAKWESVRRALTMSGATVTCLTPKQTEYSQDIFCRDIYFKAGNHFFFSDTSLHSGSNLHSIVIQENQNKTDRAIKNLLQQQEAQKIVIIDAWFECGNIVVDSVSKTIFFGHENTL